VLIGLCVRAFTTIAAPSSNSDPPYWNSAVIKNDALAKFAPSLSHLPLPTTLRLRSLNTLVSASHAIAPPHRLEMMFPIFEGEVRRHAGICDDFLNVVEKEGVCPECSRRQDPKHLE